MKSSPLLLLSLLGVLAWAQGRLGSEVSLEEPAQSFVFHVEGTYQLEGVAQQLLRSFPELERVLPCERGGYLVLLPRQVLSEEASRSLCEAVSRYLQSQNLRPYYKPSASVVELAQNCDQLVKPLLNR
jgi:hypothetical protein